MTLSRLLEVQPDITVVAVNDGSTDRSADEILAISSEHIVLLDLPFNCGIGTAVETGLRYAARNQADYAVKFDGDGQHLAEEIEDLLTPLRNGTADMTIGSRFVKNIAGFKSTFSRRCGIALFRGLSWVLTGYAVPGPGGPGDGWENYLKIIFPSSTSTQIVLPSGYLPSSIAILSGSRISC